MMKVVYGLYRIWDPIAHEMIGIYSLFVINIKPFSTFRAENYVILLNSKRSNYLVEGTPNKIRICLLLVYYNYVGKC